MSKRAVLTVPGVIAADIREQIASGKRPRADYLELARRFNADLLDCAAARMIAGRTGTVLSRQLTERQMNLDLYSQRLADVLCEAIDEAEKS